MAGPEIFISYDHDNGKQYRNLPVAWDKNDEFGFAFGDCSADVSIQSTNADAMNRAVSAKIRSATHFLYIVGKTSKSGWVA